jgi:gamma-glutamylputrescine oxidase
MSVKLQFSYWERESFLKDIDIAVIGCGIVGLNAAIKLKQERADLKISIIERGALPSGASTKNAGFACFGSVSEIIDDIKIMGEEKALNLISNRWDGLKRLREVVGDQNMDFQSLGGFEVFRNEDQDLYEECIEIIPWLNKQLKEKLNLENAYNLATSKIEKFKMKGFSNLIWNQWEGQIDPGKMMNTLINKARFNGISIINGMHIDKLEDLSNGGVRLIINGLDEILVKKVIVATNGFARQLLPELEVKAARNQVIVTEPIENLKLDGCFHFDHGYFYWRNINNRILLGGGRHLFKDREFTEEIIITDEVISMLKEFLYNHIVPGLIPKIDISWAGILGLGPVKSPIIKQVSDNITVAVRMGGMGVALGTLAGEEGAVELLKNS